MSENIAQSEAQSRNCKNSGAAPCYLLLCPFCGTRPSEDSTGMIVCKVCLEKDNAVAAPDAEAWNKRHAAELTKREIRLLHISVERYADDTESNMELSGFEWKEKVKLKEELENLSVKIRLWLGR